MPAKKLTKKTETPEAAVAPAPENPKSTVRKSAAVPKSSAATHKSAAPRTTAPRAAETPRVKKEAPAKPAFDAALHHEEIAREAYFLWEARGFTHGNEGEDWHRATEVVRARHQ
jgi:hypothetical protein